MSNIKTVFADQFFIAIKAILTVTIVVPFNIRTHVFKIASVDDRRMYFTVPYPHKPKCRIIHGLVVFFLVNFGYFALHFERFDEPIIPDGVDDISDAWYNFNISVPRRYAVNHGRDMCGTLWDKGVIMVIYTGISNHEARRVVRSTYANKPLLRHLNIRHVFVIGKLGGNDKVSESVWNKVLKEQEKYQDIIIGDFVDTYSNLSYKGLTALRFVKEYCAQAQWVIKVDDDVLADIPTIMYLLRTYYSSERLTMFGLSYVKAPPILCEEAVRDNFQWCINSSSIYVKIGYYPPYLAGHGYVLTSDLVSLMIKEAASKPPFVIDDIYITGIITENIKHKKVINWENRIPIFKLTPFKPGKHIFSHSATENITIQWEILEKARQNFKARGYLNAPCTFIRFLQTLCLS